MPLQVPGLQIAGFPLMDHVRGLHILLLWSKTSSVHERQGEGGRGTNLAPRQKQHPPTLPRFMDMAPLENLSRDQRYYHYVQCPVLCLDSNSSIKRKCLYTAPNT